MITIFMSNCNSIMVSPTASLPHPLSRKGSLAQSTESVAREVDMLRYVIKNGGLYSCAKCFILSVGGD